ncbi:lytic transglycosylase domain-containing protein [Sphingomonas sp. RB3P16]|uniref:lytic transglycosylase domain-containing protein n=1 Tax=Parasphingomonas frigoris TaxID=3096163 RepID=UPI002FC5B35E
MASPTVAPLSDDDAPQTAAVTIRGMRIRPAPIALYRAAAGYAAPDRMVQAVGYRYRVDPNLLAAIVHAESRGRAGAISSKGALGLMQVMPATARGMGVAEPRAMLTNPGLALTTGARYLKHLQSRLGNDVPLVVAAYNAGPGAVLKAGRRVPRYRETQGYVRTVLGRYAASRAQR